MQTHANIEAAVLAFTAAWLPLSRTVTVARNIKHLVHLFGDAGAVVTHPSASRRWYVHNLTSPLVPPDPRFHLPVLCHFPKIPLRRLRNLSPPSVSAPATNKAPAVGSGTETD